MRYTTTADLRFPQPNVRVAFIYLTLRPQTEQKRKTCRLPPHVN